MILKDVGLTSLILRAANSALYSRSGRAIQSIAHAITLLGRETVRNLTGALRFIGYYARGSPGLRELMLLSVLTATQNREMALIIGYPRPEEGYLCGLFRNLGEVLIAFHYPQDYSRIISIMHQEKIPERAACVRVLGFHWDEVGARVSAAWRMPESLRVCQSGREAPVRSPVLRCLGAMTDFSQDLTSAIYRRDEGFESLVLRTIPNPQSRAVLISVRDLRRVIDSSLAETRQVLAALRIPTGRLRLERQAQSANRILQSLPVFDTAALEELDAAIQRAERGLQGDDFELGAFITSLLDAVREAGFEQVIFGLVNKDATLLCGRLASGSGAVEALGSFQLRMGRSRGLGVASLQRKIDILVDCERDGRYKDSEIARLFNPGAFALFPVVVDEKLVGCLYASRSGSAAGLEDIRPYLVRIRELITAAIQRKSH